MNEQEFNNIQTPSEGVNQKWYKQRNFQIGTVIILAFIFIGFWYFIGGEDIKGIDDTKNATSTEEALIEENQNQSTTKPQTTKTTPGYPRYDEDGASLIYYDNTGFHPTDLQVPEKTTVRFVNNSSKALRIYAVDRSISKYTSLDQPRSMSKGEYYDYVFVGTGVWTYTNQNFQSHQGTILVF